MKDWLKLWTLIPIFKAIVQVWKRASLETSEEVKLCLMRKALIVSFRQTLEGWEKETQGGKGVRKGVFIH